MVEEGIEGGGMWAVYLLCREKDLKAPMVMMGWVYSGCFGVACACQILEKMLGGCPALGM